MRLRTFLIAAAVAYIALAIYFQSVCLGFSMLTFFFGVFWLGEAIRKRPDQGATLQWLLLYSIPVLLSFSSALALIAFAVNVYIGGLVVAFESGVLITGFLFAMMERG